MTEKQLHGRSDTLIFLPTYNERRNVSWLMEQLRKLLPAADFLFIDDASPDGTGTELDRLARRERGIHVMHRPARMGLGSAHQEALRFGYEHDYRLLVTMDADGTHAPEDIPRLLAAAGEGEVIVGSRFQVAAGDKRNRRERLKSRLVHWLTSRLLRLPWDMSNACRLYCLEGIDPAVFSRCRSRGYAFFPESLYLLSQGGLTIREVPICLAGRRSGKSKMRTRDIGEWIARLLVLGFQDERNNSCGRTGLAKEAGNE